MNAVIEINNLSTGYQSRQGDTIVTSNIDTNLNVGELVCLIGPNGAGKSTLMRTVAGAQKAITGSVTLAGRDIREYRPRELARKLSLVLTDRVFAGMLSAYEVIALGRFPYTNWTGKLSKEDHRIIQESIHMAGAEDLVNRTLSELSDGERQKIMIARAFAQEPDVMIMDEVTAFLDLPRRVEIVKLLKRMAHESGKSILLSTHDMDLALRGADRIWLLPKGEGMLTGSPEDLVLNGSFEDAFISEGIQFDRSSGSFEVHGEFQSSVALDGQGTHAIWAQRALQRNGIQLDDQAPTKVIVKSNSGDFHCVVEKAGNQESAQSIQNLIDILNAK